MAIFFHIDDWQSVRERMLHPPIWRPILLWLRHQYEHSNSLQLGGQEIKANSAKLGANIIQEQCRTDPSTPFEAHRKNVDVHCCLRGEEVIHYASASQATTLDPAEQPSPDVDTVLYHAAGIQCSALHLLPGYVAILFPEDAHRPLQTNTPLNGCSVTKAIIKIPLTVL